MLHGDMAANTIIRKDSPTDINKLCVEGAAK
jgi:hypothetical protein